MDDYTMKLYIDEVFTHYDKDRSGSLDKSELVGFFNQLFQSFNDPRRVDQNTVNKMMTACDMNHDGQVNKIELFTLFKRVLMGDNTMYPNAPQQQYGQGGNQYPPYQGGGYQNQPYQGGNPYQQYPGNNQPQQYNQAQQYQAMNSYPQNPQNQQNPQNMGNQFGYGNTNQHSQQNPYGNSPMQYGYKWIMVKKTIRLEVWLIEWMMIDFNFYCKILKMNTLKYAQNLYQNSLNCLTTIICI